MAYTDNEGNYIDEGGMGPDFAVMPEPQAMTLEQPTRQPPPPPMLINSDFAVDTGGGAPTGGASTSSLAVNTGAPRTYLTPPDMSEYLLDKNWADSTDPDAAPGSQQYVGANAYTPEQMAAIPNYVGPPGTGVGAYDVRNWDRSSAGQLAVDPNATYRVLNGSGEVVYEGSGESAAKSAAYNANLLTADPWTANATVQAKSPSGDWSTLAAVTPKVHKDDAIVSFAFDIIPQLVAAGLTGGQSLVWQMAAAAAATVPGSVAYQRTLTESLVRAATAAATTGVMQGTTAGQNISKGISNTINTGISGVRNAFVPAVTSAGTEVVANAGANAVSEVIVNGVKQWVPTSAVNAFLATGATLTGNVAGGSDSTTLKGGDNGDTTLNDDPTITKAPPTGNVSTGTPLATNALTPAQVDAVTVTADLLGKKLGVDLTDFVTRAIASGINATQFPEWVARQNPLSGVEVTATPRDPFNPVVPVTTSLLNVRPTINTGPGFTTTGTYDNQGNLTPLPNPALTPLAKVAEWIKTHPGLSAQLGVAGLTTLKSVIDGNKGSGGTGGGGAGFQTIAQQQAGLPDIFRAQLGAPRGMFSALGTAGTPYTPRPIRNLLPDPVVNTNGSGNPSGTGNINPSGTAALADYLRRYPDVAAEAKANPGAYDDVNEDGVIDDYDFALGHYILAGQYDGHTMNVKEGGYIQHPSRDTDMHNSRFQVMRKADGGAVVDPNLAAMTSSAPSMASQLAQSLAVDPRALAESYRSGTVAPPSVMQPRQSPYAGYDPGTMGGMYHYGEAPTGEVQRFNYAMAPGATPPWMADTPTGTGVYNMYGVKTGGVGAGGGGVGGVGTTDTTGTTTTGGTTGTTTTGTTTTGTAKTPISAAERAKWAAYVNAYPNDLVGAYAANPKAFGDFNNDGVIDIADFGLGQYTNYGKAEGRSLTGPAAPVAIANTGASSPDTTVNTYTPPRQYGSTRTYGQDELNTALTVLAKGGAYTDPTSPFYKGGAPSVQDAIGVLDEVYAGNPGGYGFAVTQNLGYDPNNYDPTSLPGYKRGGSSPRNNFAVQGPGTGRSDSIPAALSDGEYVMDAETVALLGDGSSKAGAKKLDAMRSNLRKAKGRNLAKGRFSVNAKAPEAYLSGGRT